MRVDYLAFRKQWYELGCFSIQQIYSWNPKFNRSNLINWTSKGQLIKLRNGWYAFQDYLSVPDFSQYIANRIYRPSYISLHTALAHYGMIPEEVLRITSVSTLKTYQICNGFGDYTYQTIMPEMMFGYEPKIMSNGRSILFATPEKALLDLLYLYPFYISAEDMLGLRLDEDFMAEEFDKEKFLSYVSQVGSKALSARINTLITTYGL